jgi:predicted amidohydrolase
MNLVLVQPQLCAFDTEYNIEAIRNVFSEDRDRIFPGDIIVLPEHVVFSQSRNEYLDYMQSLARETQCTIVGGSYHEQGAGGNVNTGTIVSPTGEQLGVYEKLRPYADERKRVNPGNIIGEIEVAGRHLLVLICADFWFSDLFYRTAVLPDMVLVPALSVTRKPGPDYSRALWKHLAVARAYEFGTYVGIADWAHPSQLPKLVTS